MSKKITLNGLIRNLIDENIYKYSKVGTEKFYKELYSYYESITTLAKSNAGRKTFEAKVRNAVRAKLNCDGAVLSSKQFTERTQVTQDEMVADRLFTREPQSLEDVEIMYNIDKTIWFCDKFTVSNWDITSTKAGKTATNYAVKATFKRRTDAINYEELVEKFIKDTNNYKPNHKSYKYNITHNSKMLEIALYDVHFGKLAWGLETGSDYDHKIAKKIFIDIINDIILRTEHINYEKIVFVVGQDFFNFDTVSGTTTKGTATDNDLRWQKLFTSGCEALIEGIDIMQEQCPVDVIWVKGNHDTSTSYYATAYIDAWYRNNKNVDVDVSPTPRKYYRYGNTLLGFTHGDKEKNRLSGIMSIEKPEWWGKTKYREFHCGHFHSEIAKETSGLIIRNISSVCSNDAWHTDLGYIGAVKKAQAFVWDYEYGLDSIINSVVKV